MSSGSSWSRASATKSACDRKVGLPTGEAPRLVSGRGDRYTVCASLPVDLDRVLLFFRGLGSKLLPDSVLVDRLLRSAYL